MISSESAHAANDECARAIGCGLALDELHRELGPLGEPRMTRDARHQAALELPRVGGFAVHLDAVVSQLADNVVSYFASVVQMINVVEGEQETRPS
jgi:hypothetical protein